MTQAPVAPESKEIWELTVPGRVCVVQLDAKGQEKTQMARGKGQRLRITRHERELTEERIRREQNNPFRNGKLRWVNRETSATDEADFTPGDQELDDEVLVGLFAAEDPASFVLALGELSEVNVRRLRVLAEDPENKAIAYQTVAIKDFIDEKWPVGGSMPTYDAMQQTPDTAVTP